MGGSRCSDSVTASIRESVLRRSSRRSPTRVAATYRGPSTPPGVHDDRTAGGGHRQGRRRVSMSGRSISRREFLRSSAALGAVGATAGMRGGPTAGAATKLSSVSAMVAEAEVAWEKEMQQKWNKANPDTAWERENIGWEGIFEKVLAYEKAGSPPSLGYGWTGFTADWHQMGIID